MLIDTHCHLDASEFDSDRDNQVTQARAAGVAGIIVPAVDIGNLQTVHDLAHRHPGCCYALGIHPIFVDRAADEDLVSLRARVAASIDDPRLVAIGEIGLDFFLPGLDRERQLHFYREQLKIARDFDLPVLLHVRRSQDAILAQLRRLANPGGIAHAFNGSHQQANEFLKLGLAMGFGGAMTFTRALQIRRLAVDLPAEAHVLETDSPDIPPQWQAHERNSPAQVAGIADVFAQLRGQTLSEALAQTGANALRVIPRLGAALGSVGST